MTTTRRKGKGDIPTDVTEGNPLAVRVGAKIRELRQARGMRQETLARAVGYSHKGTISQFENGLALPSVEKVVEIAGVLRVHPGELFNDVSEVSPTLPGMAPKAHDLLLELDQGLTKAMHTFQEAVMPLAKRWPQESRRKVADRLRLFSYAVDAFYDEIEPLLAKREAKP